MLDFRYTEFWTIVIILVAIVLFSIDISAQRNHSIYATVGKSFSLSYEGIFTQSVRDNGDIAKLGFRIHGGKIYSICMNWDYSERKFIAGSAVLTAGKNRSFLDMWLGVGYGRQLNTGGEPAENIAVPVANIGYRYEVSSWLIRTGVGLPDVLYASLGLRF